MNKSVWSLAIFVTDHNRLVFDLPFYRHHEHVPKPVPSSSGTFYSSMPTPH